MCLTYYLPVAYKGTLALPSPGSHNRLMRKGFDTFNAINTTVVSGLTNITLTIQNIASPSDLVSHSQSFATDSFWQTTAVNITESLVFTFIEAAHSTVPNLTGPTQTTQNSISPGPTMHTSVANLNRSNQTTQNAIFDQTAHSSVIDLIASKRTTSASNSSPTDLLPPIGAPKTSLADVTISSLSLTTSLTFNTVSSKADIASLSQVSISTNSISGDSLISSSARNLGPFIVATFVTETQGSNTQVVQIFSAVTSSSIHRETFRESSNHTFDHFSPIFSSISFINAKYRSSHYSRANQSPSAIHISPRFRHSYA